MAQPITSITIVGGGTAGWMTATYLATRLKRPAGERPVEITLIESPGIGTIGVGEATVPLMRRWLRDMAIDEHEFLWRCNGSFKLGVKFSDWNRDEDGRPLEFVHPFHGIEADIGGFKPAAYFLKYAAAKGATNCADYLSPSCALIDNYRAPRQLEHPDYEKGVRYAYHLDAGLFAQYLQEIAVSRGVNHLRDDVVDVELGENGFVAALHLKELGRRPVELVVDCTGFRGLIIQKALDEPFESYGRHLLCDRALAVQHPHPDPEHLEPCTRATALGAGWSWRVPLYSRVGTGYVFSSAFLSDEAATEEFLRYLGPAGDGAEPRVIKMRVGRSRRSWVKNCVAIGLSSGFIEPLESTAIFIIQSQARWLVSYFPDLEFSPDLAARYNALLEQIYREIRDFNILHYITNNRSDTEFWHAARNDLEVPESLRENLALWHHALPAEYDFSREFLFNHWSYMLVLFGKRYFDHLTLPTASCLEEADWRDYQAQMDRAKADLLRHLPDHHSLLCEIRRAVEARQPALPPELARGRLTRPTVGLPSDTFQPEIHFEQPQAAPGNLL
jgi:hypothetical protein